MLTIHLSKPCDIFYICDDNVNTMKEKGDELLDASRLVTGPGNFFAKAFLVLSHLEFHERFVFICTLSGGQRLGMLEATLPQRIHCPGDKTKQLI